VPAGDGRRLGRVQELGLVKVPDVEHRDPPRIAGARRAVDPTEDDAHVVAALDCGAVGEPAEVEPPDHPRLLRVVERHLDDVLTAERLTRTLVAVPARVGLGAGPADAVVDQHTIVALVGHDRVGVRPAIQGDRGDVPDLVDPADVEDLDALEAGAR
jgi:hypothetical protein